MRAGLLDLLRQRGVNLDEQTVQIAGAFLDRQLGDQVARLAFGHLGQVRRAAQDDPILAEALRAAGRARTQADLLAFAAQTGQGASAQRP
jgi:hypothetical protein